MTSLACVVRPLVLWKSRKTSFASGSAGYDSALGKETGDASNNNNNNDDDDERSIFTTCNTMLFLSPISCLYSDAHSYPTRPATPIT